MAARHDEYYFEDENAIFQVGDKLFRVHKRLLVGSENSAFASMFSLPQSQGVEGQTDEKPIILKGDKLEEFEALMRILYPPLLDNIRSIPIITYVRAMRIAIKYSMDDVQTAIVRGVNSLPIMTSTAIARLALLAEFPDHFSKSAVKRVFTLACSKDYRPSGHDLKPLMVYPNLLALMMQYREEIIQPDQAIWNKKPAQFDPNNWLYSTPAATITPEDKWLDAQFESLGFT